MSKFPESSEHIESHVLCWTEDGERGNDRARNWVAHNRQNNKLNRNRKNNDDEKQDKKTATERRIGRGK